MHSRITVPFLILALLCTATYLRSLTLPLIEDDFPNILLARTYGSPAGAPALFHDGVSRSRATSYWVMFALWKTAHLNRYAYHLASVAIHIVNTCLLYLLCLSWKPMRQTALWSAAFFAVHEGHQEAVMWFSAINELLMFFFGTGALLCWIKGQESAVRWRWHLAGCVLFAFALISKESAVIFLPLMILVTLASDSKHSRTWLAPYAALAAVAVVSVISTRSYSFRFSDGSFSWHAPFGLVLLRSGLRLIWIWGFALAALMLLRKDFTALRTGLIALAWSAISLLPYSFPTYTLAIPSRQVYLASRLLKK